MHTGKSQLRLSTGHTVTVADSNKCSPNIMLCTAEWIRSGYGLEERTSNRALHLMHSAHKRVKHGIHSNFILQIYRHRCRFASQQDGMHLRLNRPSSAYPGKKRGSLARKRQVLVVSGCFYECQLGSAKYRKDGSGECGRRVDISEQYGSEVPKPYGSNNAIIWHIGRTIENVLVTAKERHSLWEGMLSSTSTKTNISHAFFFLNQWMIRYAQLE